MNFPFVTQVAFMGLEITGYAQKNLNKVWVDSNDYVEELKKAVTLLDKSQIFTSIYNIPLCLIPKDIWKYSCKSISNWKQSFLPQCNECTQKNNCCGLFSTSRYYSNEIKTLTE